MMHVQIITAGFVSCNVCKQSSSTETATNLRDCWLHFTFALRTHFIEQISCTTTACSRHWSLDKMD